MPISKREVVRMVFEHRRPPYVPWSFGFTHEAHVKLQAHYGDALEATLDSHYSMFRGSRPYFEALPGDCVRDPYGVVWDQSVDKDIGVIRGQVLPEPDLSLLKLPDPDDPRFIPDDPAKTIRELPDGFRVYDIGFSLYERAWTLRGLDTFLEDLIAEPEFASGLLNAIADHNIARIERLAGEDFDAVYFGDDWGDQRGVQMGPARWREMIKPVLKRMYDAVHRAGKFVTIHSCGKVDGLFDDLVEIGLNCFNPFQPEVMDVEDLMRRYRGRLTFFGGLSTQRTLPYGSVSEVLRETERLLALGREGNYIFAPAHAVEGDVPVENMVAFIERVRAQRD